MSTEKIDNDKPVPNDCRRIFDLVIKLISYNQFNYYTEMCTYLTHYHTEQVKSCSINVTGKGLSLYWNKKFVEEQSDEELLFVLIHNIFHVLLNHHKRTMYYDKRVADIVTDMIINQIIYDDIISDSKVNKLIKIPKYKDKTFKIGDFEIDDPRYGKNNAVFIPIEFGDISQSFEVIYERFRDEQIKYRKKKGKQRFIQTINDGTDADALLKELSNSDEVVGTDTDVLMNEIETVSSGDVFIPTYGKYGLNGAECFNLESILEMLERGIDLSLDTHVKDEVNEDVKRTIVESIKDRLKNKGNVDGNMSQILMKLHKPKKDYLKEIKRCLSNDIFGSVKHKSVSKLNRRGIEGIKGFKKQKSIINVVLDTSGSMGGDFESVLSYVFQRDISINLIQIDTVVKKVEKIKNYKELQNVMIEGLGGTELTPAIHYLANPDNKLHTYRTVILTDGFTDVLDFTYTKTKTLILTTDTAPRIHDPNGIAKIIMIDKEQSSRAA